MPSALNGTISSYREHRHQCLTYRTGSAPPPIKTPVTVDAAIGEVVTPETAGDQTRIQPALESNLDSEPALDAESENHVATGTTLFVDQPKLGHWGLTSIRPFSLDKERPANPPNTLAATPNPEKATLDSVDRSPQPVETTTSPVDATPTPIEATINPIEATTSPIKATISPIEATTSPTEATSIPMEAPPSPVEPPSDPVQSDAADVFVESAMTVLPSGPSASDGMGQDGSEDSVLVPMNDDDDHVPIRRRRCAVTVSLRTFLFSLRRATWLVWFGLMHIPLWLRPVQHGSEAGVLVMVAGFPPLNSPPASRAIGFGGNPRYGGFGHNPYG